DEVKELISPPAPPLEFVCRRQDSNAEDCANHFGVRMLPPDRGSKHLHYRFSNRVVLRTTNLIQHSRDAETAGMRTYRRNPRFSPTVGIMQLENKFAWARHVRCEKGVTGVNAGKMKVSRKALS